MQIHPRPRLEPVHAALDTLRFLLVRLAALLTHAWTEDTAAGRWLRRRIAAELAVRLYEFKNQVAVLAVASLPGIPVCPPGGSHGGGHRVANGRPRYTAPGFRRSRGQGSALRHVARPAMRRLRAGSLRARVGALAAAIADPAPFAAEIAARLEAVHLFARLIPVAPSAQELNFCEFCGFGPAPDTS